MAQELARYVGLDDPRVAEVNGILGDWIRARSERERDAVTSTTSRLYGRIPEVAAVVCREYES
jgi:hypothetical protein